MNKRSDRLRSASRREFLQTLAGTSAVLLAGCGGGSSSTATDGPLERAKSLVVDGYTDRLSYRPGDRMSVFTNASASGRSSMRLLDVSGKIVVDGTATVAPQKPSAQAPWQDGFNYQPSAEIPIPELTSGVYLVEGLIPVIIKSPLAAPADIVVVYPTNTEAAYNDQGGRSMYSQPDRATVVSFLRPAARPLSKFADAFLKWIAGAGLAYKIRFIADIDMDDFDELVGARVVVIIGHSEYWTRKARENFDRFVDGGGRALVLSGNTMWWQVRYSSDRTQMICFKDLPDPERDPLLRTCNWIHGALRYPILSSIGAEFPRGGYGIEYDRGTPQDLGWNGFRIANPGSPVFRGLSLKPGDVIAMPSVEYDGAPLINAPVTQGEPRIDSGRLGFERIELIGYDYGYRAGDTVGTWIAFKRSTASGTVINGASTDWCSMNGVGGSDGERIRRIILNMLDLLVNDLNVFSS